MLSWLGAVLLLLIAGMEADLALFRQKAKPGVLAAAFAVVPSLAAGAIFSRLVLHEPASKSLFLGVVLTVTAVSVIAKVLIERELLRRGYAQVILAAGIASEVFVWLLVAVAVAVQQYVALLLP